MEVLADQPELLALAGLAAVPASKMAAAFNDAEHFFDHLGLEELERIRAACERLGALTVALAEAMQIYVDAVRAAVAESATEVPVAD